MCQVLNTALGAVLYVAADMNFNEFYIFSLFFNGFVCLGRTASNVLNTTAGGVLILEHCTWSFVLCRRRHEFQLILYIFIVFHRFCVFGAVC